MASTLAVWTLFMHLVMLFSTRCFESKHHHMAFIVQVIERIHKNFFSHTSLEEADVRAILASEQRKILAGCRIVFSRIIPVGEAKPHLHPLWQTAEQFGAVCTTQVDEHVTHVVTNSLGTDKVRCLEIF